MEKGLGRGRHPSQGPDKRGDRDMMAQWRPRHKEVTEMERREQLAEGYELAEHCRFIAAQIEGCLGRAQRRLLSILKAVSQKAPQDWGVWLRGNLELVGDNLLEAEGHLRTLKAKALELVALQEGLLRKEARGR
jgi:hypothetical protein